MEFSANLGACQNLVIQLLSFWISIQVLYLISFVSFVLLLKAKWLIGTSEDCFVSFFSGVLIKFDGLYRYHSLPAIDDWSMCFCLPHTGKKQLRFACLATSFKQPLTLRVDISVYTCLWVGIVCLPQRIKKYWACICSTSIELLKQRKESFIMLLMLLMQEILQKLGRQCFYF